MDYHFSYRTKNGSVCLILSYKIGKKWHQKTRQGFKTQREARQHQDELLDQVRQQAGLVDAPDLRRMTLRQFWAIFERDRKQELTFTTLRAYKAALVRLSGLLDLPLIEITPPAILNALNAIQMSTQTRNLSQMALQVVLKHAVAYKILSRNPVQEVKYVRDKNPGTVRAYTREELTEILEHYRTCRLHPRFYYYVVLTLARTGMRYGEVSGLTWDKIDFAAGVIHVRQQYGPTGPGRYGLKPLKTVTSNRDVPMPQDLRDALLYWRQTEPMRIDRMLWPPEKLKTCHNQLGRYLSRHYPGRSVHSFRHTYATLLLSQTGDINLVAHVLGDKVTTVANTYVNYTQDIAAQAASSVNKMFG